jgi:crotonobetainyl-CoA:carnitine CoA-transferase CaiB-like acyl-CoA transferase
MDPLLLDGVKVLDLSRVLAGPFATQLLGDLGADVIKVEHAQRGDDTRHWGPPFVGGESAYFLSANRNKRSIKADFEHADDLAQVKRLAAEADVVIENYRRGALTRFGLDYPALQAANPRLVYGSITSFGPGRDQALPGYDFLVQARGGVMGITGAPDGEPMKVGVAVADIVCGLYASNAVLAALYRRAQTGTGSHVEIPLFESQVSWLANRAQDFLVSGEDQGRLGNAHPTIVPYQVFRASDGPIALAVGNNLQFAALCRALDREELATDDRFDSNPGRVAHRDVLVPILSQIFALRPAAEWIERIGAAGVPCGPVNNLAGVFADPHLASTNLVQSIGHPTAGSVRLLASPILVDGKRPPIRRAPPLHGQHSAEVLNRGWG